MQKFIKLLILLLITMSALEAATDPKQNLPVDPSVRIGKLSNGLTYYIQKNQKPANRAEFRLVVNAGSVLEDENQQGLAHFTEHMAFNGTKNFKKNEMTEYLGSIGMGFAGGLNAFTSFDMTVYMLKAPTDNQEQFKKAFLVLSDWSNALSFDHDEIDKERGVIIEEWRGGRGAGERMWNKNRAVMLKGSKYAERNVIGTKEVLESFKYETIKKFYKDWYRPDLQAVVAVGDFNVDEVEKEIKATFGKIPAVKNPRKREVFAVPSHDETLFSIATDKEAEESSVSVIYKHPVKIVKTVEDLRFDAMGDLYNTMLNNRLSEITKKANAPFVQGYSYNYPMVKSIETYMLGAQVKDNGIEAGLESILTEAERVSRFGFTQGELDRAKLAVSKKIEIMVSDKDKQDSDDMVWSFVGNYLSQSPMLSPEQTFALTQEILPQISLADVNGVIKEWISDKNRVISASCPDKQGVKVPTEKDLMAVFTKVKNSTITAYEDKTSSEPLMKNMPQKGKIITETKNDVAGTKEWKLSNGAKVILKKTDFKNEEIVFNAFSKGGVTLSDTANWLSSTLSPAVVGAGGVAEFDDITLDKMLTGKMVEVRPSIDPLSEGFSGKCSPNDLETMLQLTNLYAISPRKDSESFGAFISQMEGYIQNSSLSPENVFNDSINAIMSSYHPLTQPLTVERLKKIDLDKAFAFYKERFADASDFTFIFVGNFDEAKLRDYTELYLASLPSLNRNETFKDLGFKYPKGVIDKKVFKGEEPKSVIRMAITGEYEYSKQNNTDLQAMIMVLNEKLRENIREKMSGVYYVQSWPEINKYPNPTYNINIILGCSPERVEELSAAIKVQLDSLSTTEVTQKYITVIKETQKKQRETSLKENSYWLSSLKNYDWNQMNIADFVNHEAYIEKFNAKSVMEAAKKYLTYKKNLVRVVLYPEAQATDNK